MQVVFYSLTAVEKNMLYYYSTGHPSQFFFFFLLSPAEQIAKFELVLESKWYHNYIKEINLEHDIFPIII